MSTAKTTFLTSAHNQPDAWRREGILTASTPSCGGGKGATRGRNWGFAAFSLALATVWLMGAPPAARAAKVLVRLEGGGIYYKDVASYRDRRMTKVIAQTEDYSCGAAALATLLHYYFGRHLNERDAILGMFKTGEQKEIQKRGFSLLDMKRYCQGFQYKAQGFRVEDVHKLRDLKIPVIGLLDTRQYKHFVVIRGADSKFVYLSDPSFGNRKMPLEDFDQDWNHVVLVVTGAVDGTPEGLLANGDELSLKNKDQIVETAYGNYWNRAAMDPSFALVTRSIQNTLSLSGFFTGR